MKIPRRELSDQERKILSSHQQMVAKEALKALGAKKRERGTIDFFFQALILLFFFWKHLLLLLLPRGGFRKRKRENGA